MIRPDVNRDNTAQGVNNPINQEKESKAAALGAKIGSFLPLNTVGRTFLLGAHVITTGLSLATLGLSREINDLSDDTFKVENDILRKLFYQLVSDKSKTAINLDELCGRQDGILTRNISNKIDNFARVAANSENIFARHVLSRGLYAINTVVRVATQVADLALSVLGLAGAILTLGRDEKINTFAHSQLYSSFIVKDLCMNLRMIVNPHQRPSDVLSDYLEAMCAMQ